MGGAGREGKKGWIHTLSHTSYKRLDFVFLCVEIFMSMVVPCAYRCVRAQFSASCVCVFFFVVAWACSSAHAKFKSSLLRWMTCTCLFSLSSNRLYL